VFVTDVHEAVPSHSAASPTHEETTMTITETTLDPQALEEAGARVMSIYAGSMLSYMIDIGHSTGLTAAVGRGPGTSEELAARAALVERYVREWLGAMVTGGLVGYDPPTATYTLSPELSTVLNDGPMPLATFAAMNTHLGKHVHAVARAFREGGGVPYAAYRPEFTDLMDQISRTGFDLALVDGVLPLVDGLVPALETGALLADVCCGSGHALVVLGRRFPASTFVGFDLDEGAVDRARAEATDAGLTNVAFHVADAADLGPDHQFDAVLVFDAIHDQVDPAAVLGSIRDALKPGGVFVMKEPRAAETLEGNIGNPIAPILYSVSTLHCMTVSLAHGGAGIGTAMSESVARGLLTGAGFTIEAVHEAPGDPADGVYVSRTTGGS
jgi:2-polyprenyl-3-methyl-5-hydroxy-6-metoxy-1,4-benzoquinol methylase